MTGPSAGTRCKCEEGKIEMADHDIRAALDRHWAASDANDFETEHQIYREDAVLEYPQSGERIRGRRRRRRLRLSANEASQRSPVKRKNATERAVKPA